MPAHTRSLRQTLAAALPALLVFAGLPAAAVQGPATAHDTLNDTGQAGDQVLDFRVHVRVDPRVELLCVIYRLAGFREYNQGRITSYTEAVDRHFEPWKDHPVIACMQRNRSENAVAYDSAIALAVHMTDDGTWRPISPLANTDLELYNSDKWSPERAAEAMDLVRAFAADTDFASFQAANQELYDVAEERMRSLLERKCNLDWFESFFGVPPKAPFTLCIGLLNGPANYGSKYRGPGDVEHLYAILGAWLRDDEGLPEFDDSVIPTVVHEFNHSFVNHLVDKHVDELASAGEAMYPAVERRMRRQAYGNWRTMFYESLVRACVIRYILAEEGIETAAEHVQEEEIVWSFVWTDELTTILHEYELNRDRYPTLESFMPRIVEYFNDLGPRFDTVHAEFVERYDASRPTVIATTPMDLSAPVDPATTSLSFTFSRPMSPDYSVNLAPGAGEEQYPGTGDVGFDETGTVFTIKVALEPGRHYAFTLNNTDGGSFKAKDGIPLASFLVSFDTSD